MKEQKELKDLDLEELRKKRNELEKILKEIRQGKRFHYEREPAEKMIKEIKELISEKLNHGQI